MGTKWKKKDIVTKIHSKWIDIYCEIWSVDNGEEREYWRVEKKDSLIVIAKQGNCILFPNRTFRPGVERVTLDLPGGRLSNSSESGLEQGTKEILFRELGVQEHSIENIEYIEKKGKDVNSSFNSQKLFITLAVIRETINVNGCEKYNENELPGLLSQLTCLQCCFALNEYLKVINT